MTELTRVALPLLDNGDVYFAGYNDTSGKRLKNSTASIRTPVDVTLPGPATDIATTWWDGYAALVSS